ncbi:ankyrin repeat protein [Trichoderma sp. SZMC 28012]
MSADRYQNFRLRGIPCECETRADVRELVKRILSIEAGASVVVHSLAISPIEQISKVATLSFHALPECLSDCSRNEWVFNLPVDETSGEDDFSRRKSLVFDTHFSGFTPLQHTKDDDCYVDVIAISGLGGHAFGSFKERHGSFMWLRDALPIDVPGARILIYGYDTRLIRSRSFQNLTDLGKALQIDMKGIRGFTQTRPIIFIGHSLGGLVIKEAIVKLKEALDEKDDSILCSTAGFLFFGVPHQGMAIESLVPLVKDYPNRSLLESLNKNSALLQRLEKDFSNAFGTKRLRIVSFYETENSPTAVETEDGKWKLSGDPKVLVDVSSATYGSNNQHPINRNHSEMVKYNNQYDELYTRVRIALEPLVRISQNKSIALTSSAWLSDENIGCLRSLSFREQEHRYKEIHFAKDTCEWLLDDSQYQAWMNRSRGLFWIKGNPGAGKSVLMKFAVTMMDHRKSGELVVSFFFHGRGAPLQKNPLGVFRALLNSMLIYFPEYLAQLTERFNDQERRFGTYQEKRWTWAKEELQDFMSEVLTRGTRNRPVAIFVDAIDECGEVHAKYLLEYFKSLMNDVEREEAQVKICFSSRHFPLLGLDTISTIFVEERNDKDIRLVIRERLKQIQPKAKREQIEKEILLKAQGGFQWAVLITSIVIDGNTIGIKAEKLHEKIKTTPEALDELYTDILSGVTRAENHQMTKLFQWVLFAERPLSAQELREALATDKEMTCTTVSELRSHDSWSDTLKDFEKHVRHISRGLVEFHTREIWEQYEPGGEDSDREVQFIHQSVADYILGKFLSHVGFGDASQSQIGAGHFEISRSCLRYLALREVSEGARLSRGTFSARFPLVPYVVRSVFHHIREVEREGIPQHDLLQLIQWDRQSKFLRKIARIWRVMDPNNAHAPTGWPFIGATPLHLLVALGSKSAFDALLQKDDVEIDGRDSDGNTPLFIALRDCHQNIALALLNRSIEWQPRHGAINQDIIQDKDTNARSYHFVDINAENDDGETPLMIALALDAEEVLLKLFEAGAHLFGQPTWPIFYAIRDRNKTLLLKLLGRNFELNGAVYFALKELSYKGCDNVLEKFLSELLKAGGNTHKSQDFNKSYEDEDDYDDEALLLASRRGQTAIVNLLLSHGASATSRNKFGRFPLLVAAENGHEPIVKLLLENGGVVDAKNPLHHGLTPLLGALQNGHEAVAKLLIDKGADIKISFRSGLTLLSWALQGGHEAIARLLINKGADISAGNEDGSILLLWALQSKPEVIVKLLNDKEADITTSDKDGLTLLLWALQSGHGAKVRLFIDTEADVNASDKNELTLLLWALRGGHEAKVRLLIEKGADVNASDKDGLTSLLWALRGGHEAKVRLLIDKGADVNASDKDGLTVLLWALRGGHEAIARLLIDKGANINVSDENKLTPLSWASRRGYEAIARLLINKGADLNTSDIFGLNPLSWALKEGHERIASILTDEGAHGNVGDQYRSTLFC